MANYANQKLAIVKDKHLLQPLQGEPFLYAKWSTLEKAGTILNGNAFKLYLYFLSWSGAEKFAFSKQDVINKWGIANATSVGRALEDLKRCGFVFEEAGVYIFYPISHTI